MNVSENLTCSSKAQVWVPKEAQVVFTGSSNVAVEAFLSQLHGTRKTTLDQR